MAFTAQSPSKHDFVRNSAAKPLGPGQYDVDSTAHKQLMAALYPKKTAPFNQTEAKLHRKESPVPGKLITIKEETLLFWEGDFFQLPTLHALWANILIDVQDREHTTRRVISKGP